MGALWLKCNFKKQSHEFWWHFAVVAKTHKVTIFCNTVRQNGKHFHKELQLKPHWSWTLEMCFWPPLPRMIRSKCIPGAVAKHKPNNLSCWLMVSVCVRNKKHSFMELWADGWQVITPLQASWLPLIAFTVTARMRFLLSIVCHVTQGLFL